MAETAAEGRARLAQKRAKAAARITEIQRDARAAGEARTNARAKLIELERRDNVKPAERAAAERALHDAELAASQPWQQRIQGAEARVRDVDQELRAFIGEHLPELVSSIEERGAAAAERLNAALAEVVAANQEWAAAAAELGATLAAVGSVKPGDVSYSRTEAVTRACAEALAAGGELGPKLRRDSRVPRLGEAKDPAIPAVA